MNNTHTDAQAPPSLGLNDLVYLFFRHKWKIIFFSLIGLGAAAAMFITDKTEYRSQAKLLVRYITERKSVLEGGARASDTIRPLDPRESSIINAEAEILRSTDGVFGAVKTVTAQKVLQAYGGGTNVADAAQLVLRKFQVDIGKSGGVMLLTLSHRDPDMAQRLLVEIIREYKKNHLQIHHSGNTINEVTQQTEEIKGRLAQTEVELRKQKKAANISNLEQSKAGFAMQANELKKAIFLTEAELAQGRAQLDDRKNSNAIRNTNDIAQANASGKPEAPTAAQATRYSVLSRRLAGLRGYEIELLQTFSESSKRVQQVQREITETEESISKLGIDPAYLAQAASSPAAPMGSGFDWDTARARIAGLEAQYQLLTNRLSATQEEAARLDAVETSIAQLERTKKLEEEEYAYYVRSLEELRLDINIDSTRRNNINLIQEPARVPPDGKKLFKKMGAAVAGGIGFGFLLALLLDFVANPSVKRSKDLEVGLRLPVLATIPDFGRRLRARKALKNGSAVQKNGVHGLNNGEIAPWDEKDPMLPYYEGLRDRVVMSYAGDLHKPKIVGLTSCNAGAGVSRLAAGLAASLSRDAERHILLVGLQRNKVAVSAFAKGRPMDGIEPPQDSQSEKELVAQNLYSLATTGRNLAGASVVQSFSDLLPKLKISDYDFIIFDLPPLTQTSGSLRLASQMERTILVVEAEETAKEKVKRAKGLLKNSQASVFTVLNRVRSYGPKAIREDL